MSDESGSRAEKPSDGREHRKQERKTALLPAVVITETGSFDCHVHNISAGGARLESTTKVSIGQPVILIIGKNPAKGGSVAWCGDGSFGVQYSMAQEDAPAEDGAPATAVSAERQDQTREPPTTFVEFKRFQGASVFINPAQVLFVASRGDDNLCEIHFAKDAFVIVHGDCKRVCSQLARQ